MRRSMPRGGRRADSSRGPLLTGHLQDLDLELELLKRKREMIEQQQQLLRQRDFSSSRYTQQRFDDYSHLYDEGPPPLFPTDYGNQLGKRRHAISPWQDDGVPPKRFPSSRGRGSGRPFDKRQGPRPMEHRAASHPLGRRSNPPFKPGPGPSKSSPTGGNRPNKSGPKPFRNDFKPSKVTKPKAATSQAPSKLASYPVEERKKLVSEASTATAVGESLVLSAECEPNQQIIGRLELALGHIIKELKQAFSSDAAYSSCFTNQLKQRMTKQALRERIRSAMIGQPVGNVTDIIERYRKVFPPTTDIKLLQETLDKPQQKQIVVSKYIQEAEPEKFFYVNMHKILDATLNEMFLKLQEIYGNIEESDESNKGNPGDRKAAPVVTKTAKPNEGTAETTEPGEDDKNIEKLDGVNENEEISDETKQSAENPDEAMTSEANPDEVKMSEANQDEFIKVAEELVEKTPETAIGQENGNLSKVDDITDLTKDEAGVQNQNKFRAPNNKEIEYFIQNSIRRKMPKLLHKYIPHLIKLLNLNKMYKTATADIYKATIDKIVAANTVKEETIKEEIKVITDSDNSITLDNSGQMRFTLPPPKYFVKIVARPSLPKRKVMQTFLDEFHPRTIKKHKRVHNLLFVGFVSKEDFDNILKAHGTALGRIILDIKVSDWSKGKEKLTGIDTTSEDADQSAVSELNEQIDDLLFSIRKADENEKIVLDDNSCQSEENAQVIDVDEQSQNDVQEVTQEPSAENIENGNTNNTKTDNTTPDVEEVTDVNGKVNTVAPDKTTDEEKSEGNDKIEALKTEAKESGRATPTRTSARLNKATPSTIKTRRASKLDQN